MKIPIPLDDPTLQIQRKHIAHEPAHFLIPLQFFFFFIRCNFFKFNILLIEKSLSYFYHVLNYNITMKKPMWIGLLWWIGEWWKKWDFEEF
jgi:hypothetical protein